MNIQKKMQVWTQWSAVRQCATTEAHFVWRELEERKSLSLLKDYKSVSRLMTPTDKRDWGDVSERTDWILDYALYAQTLCKLENWSVRPSKINFSSPQIQSQDQPKPVRTRFTVWKMTSWQDSEETAKKLLTGSQNTERNRWQNKNLCL